MSSDRGSEERALQLAPQVAESLGDALTHFGADGHTLKPNLGPQKYKHDMIDRQTT